MRTAGFEDKHLLRRVLGKPGSNDEASGSAPNDDEVERLSGDLVNRCEGGTHGGWVRRRREVLSLLRMSRPFITDTVTPKYTPEYHNQELSWR